MISLVINAGSSSVKFQVFNYENVILKGIVEIGGVNSKIKISYPQKLELLLDLKNHKEAFNQVVEILKKHVKIADIECVIHRVVHGGELFRSTVLITDEIVDKLVELTQLAPLHNPPNVEGIKLMTELMPNAKSVAVFDTAFHSTIPEHAYLYGIPYELYKKHKIRKFGFHGTSHKYVSIETIKKLNISNSRIISCHLGNGSSICAIKDGKSIDTSMGFTPMQGSIMGTRCGLIDPSIPQYLMDVEHLSSKEVSNMLNKKSGLLGLSEISSDMRILEEKIDDPRAKRAIDVFCYRLKKLIGGYIIAFGGIDVIIFTGGIGENSALVRAEICNSLNFLGLELDIEKNKTSKEVISKDDSKVKAFVIRTNEELQMVREAIELLHK
jgi:acetate kinase